MQLPVVGGIQHPAAHHRQKQSQSIQAAQPKSVTAQSVAMTMGSLPSPAPSAGSARGTPEVLQSQTFAGEEAMRRQSSHIIPHMPSQQGVPQAQSQQQLSRPISQASSQTPLSNMNMSIIRAEHAGSPAGSIIWVQNTAPLLPDIQLLRKSQQNHVPQQSIQPQAHLPNQASFQSRAYHSNHVNGGTQQVHAQAPIHPALYYQGAIHIAHGYFNSKLTKEGRLEPGLTLQKHLLTTALTYEQNPDAVYLLVLQLVCVYLVDPGVLPPRFKAIPNLKSSLNSLVLVLTNGRGLPGDFCTTFSNFPRHVSQITLLPQDLLNNVGSLLTSFSTFFPKACEDVRSRGYPLLPDEMGLLFQMYSIALQKLVHDHLIMKVFRVTSTSDEMVKLRHAFATWQAAFFEQRLRSSHISHESLEALKTQWAFQTSGYCLRALQLYASSYPVQAQGTVNQQNQQPVGRRTVSHASRPSSASSFSPSVQGTLPLPRTPAAPVRSGKIPKSNLLWKENNQMPSQALPAVYGLLDLHLWDKPMKVHQDANHAGPFYQVSAVSPMKQASIKTTEPLYDLNFHLSEEDISAFPEVLQISNAHPKEWLVKESTQILRFRCVKDEGGEQKNDTRGTVTHWPQNVYFSLNGHTLEPRRKAQWHKDLPIDLTTFAKAGLNTLSVFINKLQSDPEEKYTLIIDRVVLKTKDEILKDVYARVRPASEFIDTLNGTQSTSIDRTSGTSTKLPDEIPGGMADDDDILILDTTTTIPILDPMSSGRLCAQPVRSSCRHAQPFDLYNFLQSRPKRASDDVYAFEWSCPICKSYAGPETLQVEEFLVQVASELGRMGKADARAIVVGKDGKWVPAEEKTGSSGKDGRGRNGGRLKRQASDDSVLGVEIIDID